MRHQIRLNVIARLYDGPASIDELCRYLTRSQDEIREAIRVLHSEGIITMQGFKFMLPDVPEVPCG